MYTIEICNSNVNLFIIYNYVGLSQFARISKQMTFMYCKFSIKNLNFYAIRTCSFKQI